MRAYPISLALLAIAGLPALEIPQVTFHGFVSQGALLSDDNNYLTPDSSEGSFQFNEIALNASSQISPRLRAGVQLVARDMGQFGNDEVTIDWAFGDYRQSDLLGVRFGRFKMPLGLYNESVDIDLAFTYVLLPQSVYNIGYREIFSGQNGVQLYGHLPIDGLDYQIYVGHQNFANDSYIAFVLKQRENGYTTVDDITVHYTYGGQLTWNTPVQGLRVVGAWLQVVDFEYDGTVVVPNSRPVLDSGGDVVLLDLTTRVRTRFDQLSIVDIGTEYQISDWTMAAEYRIQHGDGEVTVDIPASPPITTASRQVSTTQIRSEGIYGLVSYQIDERWEVGSYYSVYWPNRNERGGSDSRLRDLALSLRCDILPSWTVKLEGHLMDGTAMLLSDENPDGKEPHWWLLAAKTTVSF